MLRGVSLTTLLWIGCMEARGQLRIVLTSPAFDEAQLQQLHRTDDERSLNHPCDKEESAIGVLVCLREDKSVL